jgi:hypothetical protein
MSPTARTPAKHLGWPVDLKDNCPSLVDGAYRNSLAIYELNENPLVSVLSPHKSAVGFSRLLGACDRILGNEIEADFQLTG